MKRSGPPLLWASLTWEEIGALREAGGTLALLPVGATEQHGPHLGVGMDFLGVEKLAHAVSARTGVPVLPTLPYGCSLGHSKKWPGTLSLQPQTLIETVAQVYEWFHAAGFRRLLLVNGHVGNFAPLRCALDLIRSRHESEGGMAALLNAAELSPRVRAEFFADAADWHANSAETSLMMAVAPEIVRPEKLAAGDDPDRTAGLVFAHPVNRTSANGTTGFPSRATEAAGKRLFEWMVEDLSEIVGRALGEKPPLP